MKHNKLAINMSKTKEVVCHDPNPRGLLPPPTIPNMERVKFPKLLDVFVMNTLGAGKQIEYILQISK